MGRSGKARWRPNQRTRHTTFLRPTLFAPLSTELGSPRAHMCVVFFFSFPFPLCPFTPSLRTLLRIEERTVWLCFLCAHTHTHTHAYNVSYSFPYQSLHLPSNDQTNDAFLDILALLLGLPVFRSEESTTDRQKRERVSCSLAAGKEVTV